MIKDLKIKPDITKKIHPLFKFQLKNTFIEIKEHE